MELLKQLYSIFSPSGKEGEMIKFIKDFCKDAEVKEDEHHNVYVTKGKADTYPCIVAHTDQVQSRRCVPFICGDLIIGTNKKQDSFEGLGADDKNGIWVALKCFEKFDAIKLAFFPGEEIGCSGSRQADLKFFDDCRFVLQCDRRNAGDFITSISSIELCSKKFVTDCKLKDFGYKTTSGLSTDVGELKSRGLKVCCANISCGYYEAHSSKEYTRISELQNCLAFVENIVTNLTSVYKHTYTRSAPKYPSYGGYAGGFGGSYGGGWETPNERIDKLKAKVEKLEKENEDLCTAILNLEEDVAKNKTKL